MKYFHIDRIFLVNYTYKVDPKLLTLNTNKNRHYNGTLMKATKFTFIS